jgi:nicotinate phosphoribosyltransferase
MSVISIIDTDKYKCVMGQFAYYKYPNVNVNYKFVLRTKGVSLLPYLDEIKFEFKKLEELALTSNEKKYMKSIGFKSEYLDFLENYRLKFDRVELISDGVDLHIGVKGLWHEAIYYETPILATIMEVYCRNNCNSRDILVDKQHLLEEKISFLNEINDENFKIMEFGTRRRYSQEWQELVLRELITTKSVKSTSNLYLAMKYKIKSQGTQAHELYQQFQGLTRDLNTFQTTTLNEWIDFYGNEYDVALTDILGLNLFLDSLTPKLLSNYKGFRHDSGDPYVWANNMIAYFRKNNVDPKTKILLFSDGLSVESAYDLYLKYKDITNVIFGIGTSLTNDIGVNTISIVMKLDYVNGFATIKTSDSIGKTICSDPKTIEYCHKIYKPLVDVEI